MMLDVSIVHAFSLLFSIHYINILQFIHSTSDECCLSCFPFLANWHLCTCLLLYIVPFYGGYIPRNGILILLNKHMFTFTK